MFVPRWSRGTRARALVTVALAPWVLSGCSENFGPPPPDPNRRLSVASESFAGPVISRTLSTMVDVGAGNWLLGTDRGVYRVENGWGALRFLPEHGGFSDASGAVGISGVDAIATSSDGRLRLLRTRFGSSDFLTASVDGGRSYQSLEIPSPAQQRVDRIYAWAASPRSGAATFAVVQGASMFLWREGSGSWQGVDLPVAAVDFGASHSSADGRLWLSVDLGVDWAVLRSDDGGASFVDTGVRERDEVLALLFDGNALHRVTPTGWRTDGDRSTWPGRRIRTARLRLSSAGVQFALLAESTTGTDVYLATGTTGTALPTSFPEVRLDFAVVDEAILLDDVGAVVGAADATLHRFPGGSPVSPVAFAGPELDWGALGLDRGRGEIVLAQARSGRVYRGRSDDPSTMVDLGSPLFQSQPRTVWVREAFEPGIFVGSFGAHFLPDGSAVWQSRDSGQFSYLLENFSGPVKPQVITEAPDGTLWLGAIQGDGPYRSTTGGNSWTRVHDGLGRPGSLPGEDGLPGAPQVNAFAFVDEGPLGVSTWMATFRGGIHRLSDGASPFWEQLDQGLVDAAGAVVDSCCFDFAQRAVDVRDLVVVGDGTLLAATGTGAYRLAPSRVRWEASSDGLANRDLRALAVDPSNSRRIVAVARGSADNDSWLFFSEDAGATWITVASSLVAKSGVDVVWSRPARNEVVAILETQGAWRVEFLP